MLRETAAMNRSRNSAVRSASDRRGGSVVGGRHSATLSNAGTPNENPSASAGRTQLRRELEVLQRGRVPVEAGGAHRHDDGLRGRGDEARHLLDVYHFMGHYC